MPFRSHVLVTLSALFPVFASAALCPDGKYVAGKRCKLQPDGSYTGED